MSEAYEHLRADQLDLHHGSHELVLDINGEDVHFSTTNSAIWIYPSEWSMLNHVVKWENEHGQKWYGLNQDTIDALHYAGITMISPPHPTNEIIGEWWAVEMADFDNELAAYDETGEL